MKEYLSNTRLGIITLVAIAGAEIHDCIAESVQLSIVYNVVVHLEHNGNVYKIDGAKIVTRIYEGKL